MAHRFSQINKLSEKAGRLSSLNPPGWLAFKLSASFASQFSGFEL
jgi:hypothetical protein